MNNSEPTQIITSDGTHTTLPAGYVPQECDRFEFIENGQIVAAGPWSRFSQITKHLPSGDYQFRFTPAQKKR